MKEPKKTITTLSSIDAYLDVIGYNTNEIKENINLSKEELNEVFSLGVFSNQRELLLGYNDYLDNYIDTHYIDSNMVDDYLKTK